MKVGDLIKKLRTENRLTQVELAKKLNVAPTAISAWEGHKNRPLIDKIVMMSELFDIPISRFFDELERESSRSKEQESDKNLIDGIKRIAEKYSMDLTDPATLELMDSALDLIIRMRNK